MKISKGIYSFSKIKPRITQLLIDGKFVNSQSGRTFDTYNPATEEKITSVQESGIEDVDIAVKAARRAFDEGPWRRMGPGERGRLLYRLADLIEKNIDELSMLETLDNGKPVQISKAVDMNLVI